MPTESENEAMNILSTAANAFHRDLEQDERVLWYGGPYMGRAASALMVRFLSTALLLAFYFLWSLKEIQSGALKLSTILIHMLLIACVSFGLELIAILRNKRAHYAVTDLRVLVRCGLLKGTLTEYRYDGGCTPRLLKTSGDRGIIFLTEEAYRFATEGSPMESMRKKRRRATPDFRVAFVDIPNAEQVYSLLTDALRAQSKGDPTDTEKTE